MIWFSYEPRVLGGRVTEENAAEKLAYDIFPAPEMGFKLVAESEPLFHSDDFLVDEAQVPDAPPSPGAFRVCARFELLRSSSDLIPISGALSSGCTSPLDPKVSVVLRDAELPEPLNPEAGQLFRLGCYQPVGNPKAFGATFSELVEFRVVCSSRWFVKVALGGRDPDPDGLLLETDGEGELYVTMGKRRRLRWGKDVVSGDVVSCDGALWVLLCSDDGDGLLSAGDVVVGCLRGPARWTHLGEVFPEGTCVRLELLHGAKTSS